MADTEMADAPSPDSQPTRVAIGPSENELDEKFPDRPRNHGDTLPFHELYTRLFDPLTKNRGLKAQANRAAVIAAFIERWRELVGPDLYPAFRLILPQLDRERPVYNLKEKALARLIIAALRMPKNSEDAEAMLHWKLPSHAGQAAAGDFPGRCYDAIVKRSRLTKPGEMTIAQVNDALDELAKTREMKDQLALVSRFIREMNADEMLWLIRIILRQMKIGATERTFFKVWHADAENLYNVTSSLRRVCWDLHDGKSLQEEETKVALMHCFVPQLASYQKQYEVMLASMGCTDDDPTFWIEEKLDGERMQLHMESDDSVPGGRAFKFWSRKGKDYTSLYGGNLRDKHSALTCHLKDAFDPDVEDIILDGEMITWDLDQDAMVPYGTLKTAAVAEKEHPGVNDGPRPLYRVFDCLYVNGRSLADLSLRARRKFLAEAVPRPVHRRLELHAFQVACDAAAIEPALRQVVADAAEGLVLKNPRSRYAPNARNSDWWKVKPEYMDEFGENLDCVVIGGYYGSGRRGGIPSSYLCGLRVDVDDDDAAAGRPMRCWSFFKVGGGFSGDDYKAVRAATKHKWHGWDRKRPPKEYIELAPGPAAQVEQPDIWIRPEDSVVLAVKASSAASSDSFRTGFTLRFPRLLAIRTDKKPADALSLAGFRALQGDAERKHAQNLQAAKDEKARARARRKRGGPGQPRKPALVPLHAGTAAAPYEGETTTVFEGLTVHVMSDMSVGGRKTRAELEQLVRAHGGRVIQTPDKVPGTVCVADAHLVKVASLMRRGTADVVRPRWLLDCVAQALLDGPDAPRYLLPLEPRHMFHTREESERWVNENVDEYGDSLARDVTAQDLQELVDAMDLPNITADAARFREQLEERSAKIAGEAEGDILRGTTLFFARANSSLYLSSTNGDIAMNGDAEADTADGSSVDAQLRMVRATASFAGARTADRLYEGAGITHVVVGTLGSAAAPEKVGAEEKARRHELAQSVRQAVAEWRRPPRVVAVEWIEQCWAEDTRLAEERFAVT